MVIDLCNLLYCLCIEVGLDIFLIGVEMVLIMIEVVLFVELICVVLYVVCFVVLCIISWIQFKELCWMLMVDWIMFECCDCVVIFILVEIVLQEICDCLYEELVQVFGLFNDLYCLFDSVFNDDNMYVVLISFDMLILWIYYDCDL